MKKAEREHLDAVARLGCCICHQAAEIHHCTGAAFRGMGRKASNFEVIPLCPRHHQHSGYGVAIHAGQKAWEAKFGTQAELLEQTRERLRRLHLQKIGFCVG